MVRFKMIKKHILDDKERFISLLLLCVLLLVLSQATYINRIVDYASLFKNVVSENYRLVKDDEFFRYDIYDGGNNCLGYAVDYGTPVLIRDEETGKVFLYAKYKDTDAYVPILVTEELRNDIIQAMGKQSWFVQSSDEYDQIKDNATGISILRKRDVLLEESHVLLQTETDIKAFDDLALIYGNYFAPADVGENIDIGYIYAAYEINGLAHRFRNGFIFVQDGGVMFVSADDPEQGWSLTLTYDEHKRLVEWVRTTKNAFASSSYDNWKDIFDRLNIEYEPEMKKDSPRYQAAMAQLMQERGNNSTEGISEKREYEHFINLLKEYDEEGYRYNIFGVSGMDATGKDSSSFHKLIEIPWEYRERLFEYEKERLMDSYGLSWDDSKREKIYRDCQLSFNAADRLECSWTLGQYDRVYVAALLSTVEQSTPGWEYGEAFDTTVLQGITLDEIEASLTSSDNVSFQITMSPKIRGILDNARWNMFVQPQI